ncbi:MAG: 1-acyl-sn-glycerol-3-phosphate acyltransferase [Xanthobacteraceae bacterium]|nr:1-acyl-sn-glycerol-3-phosphate acyltransferase [Xanthobacteraceae bacterium]
MQLFRSLLFNVAFYLNTFLQIMFYLPVLLLPRRYVWIPVRSWAAGNRFLLKWIAGIEPVIIGFEKVPPGGIIVASKHQSAWETYTIAAMLPDPTFVLKRELQWIPLFGWYTMKARLIPVNRGARQAALDQITEVGRERMKESRQIIIYPEGTRRPVGAPPSYKYGVAHLYGELNVPCVPVALNSGLFWPRRSLRMTPGTVRMEFLDPIEPGMPKLEFLKHLEDVIETATARLVAQGQEEIARTRT